MNLSTLAEKGLGQLIGADCEFAQVNTDTRTLKQGDLFVALTGENFDAHSMLDEALEKGACAVVAEHINTSSQKQNNASALIVEDTTKALGKIAALTRQSFLGKVLALTGSCGKTTVKGMLQSICDVAGSCIATQGNHNNHIGVPFTLLRLKESADYAVVEAGTSGQGEIAYLTQLIQPSIALVNNVKAAHLEGLGSEAAIAIEKSAIYGEDSVKIAITNLDDKYLDVMLEKINGRKTIGFTARSEQENSEWQDKGVHLVTLESYTTNEDGSVSFVAKWAESEMNFRMNILGKHNVDNALAAIACAYALDIKAEEIKAGLERFRPTAGRMESIEGIHGAKIVNDGYNANPGSMKAAVDFLSQCKNTIFVCGDMGELGEQAQALHEEIGAYAKQSGIAKVFSVGVLSQYITQAFGDGAVHCASQDDLISKVEPLLSESVTVLIKGSRSSKMENIVKALSLGEVSN